MMKFLLLELLKIYIAGATKKKSYGRYVVYVLVVFSFFLLLGVDYIFVSNKEDYFPYLNNLLIVSSVLLFLAIAVELFCVWLHRKDRHSSYEQLSESLPPAVRELLPAIVSAIPVGITVYAIWGKIRSQFFSKE